MPVLNQKHFSFFNVKAISPKAKAHGDIGKLIETSLIIKFIFALEQWNCVHHDMTQLLDVFLLPYSL